MALEQLQQPRLWRQGGLGRLRRLGQPRRGRALLLAKEILDQLHVVLHQRLKHRTPTSWTSFSDLEFSLQSFRRTVLDQFPQLCGIELIPDVPALRASSESVPACQPHGSPQQQEAQPAREKLLGRTAF